MTRYYKLIDRLDLPSNSNCDGAGHVGRAGNGKCWFSLKLNCIRLSAFVQGSVKANMSAAPVSKKSFLVQECTTNSIVVYKDRAEVKREVSIAVTQGENEVTFTGLSEAVDGDSIRYVGLKHS